MQEENFSQELSQYLDRLHQLDPEQLAEARKLITQLKEIEDRERTQEKFLPFVKHMWPGFIEGKHHEIMADAFDKVIDGKIKRLAISMPPRHTKSEFGSHYLPAYFLGRRPDLKVIETSNTGELASGFGRKVRDTINSERYQEVFPNVELKADNKAAGRWATNKGGEYFAIGVGGTVTGKGADLFIIDDPHTEQEGLLNDPKAFEFAYNWYTSGPRQRLQPGAAVVIIMTRWHKADLLGRIFKRAASTNTLDEWEIIELPAILPSGSPLWPGYWSLRELNALKNELDSFKWNAQYQQKPTSDASSIIPRGYWKRWEDRESPACDFIIQSWDTAFSEKEKADFSACQTWGIFFRSDEKGKNVPNIIILEAYKRRMEFPELKVRAKEDYLKWKPDSLIIEGKGSGTPLVQELRATGIPVQEYSPFRGNDKRVRLNAVSDLFKSGVVWAPETSWADEVIEEIAEFPAGEHDDHVDCCTQALKRMRDGGFVSLDSDWDGDEEEYHEPVNAKFY